jgi:amidohydrolase
MRAPTVLAALVLLVAPLAAQQRARPAAEPFASEIDRRTAAVLDSVVAWRRDFHRHPELGNRETRTAGIVAAHLRRLGLELRTGVAHTGVVGVLRGGRPGPVVALRADMDALPVTEEVDLPFASRARTTYNGQEVGVMHACGHDLHTAMLMGAAEVLAGMRERLSGTVVFLFQPAEEGAPTGEEGGAPLMIREGALADPAPSAIFGLHVFSGLATGALAVRPGGLMAASDVLRITVHGTQTHGGMPWRGTDPIVAAAQVVLGLQTIVSRQLELTRAPAVVTIGMIRGGVRQNIVPDAVELLGTIRTFDPAMREEVHARIRRTAEGIAAASGARAEVEIEPQTAVTWNDPALTERMLPTLRRVAGGTLAERDPTTTAEDFSAYQERIPGMYAFLGVTPPGQEATAAANHSPRFFADEGALPVGVRALANLAVDYLAGGGCRPVSGRCT